MFKKVDPKQSFPKLEERIINFWEKSGIFEKSVEKNPTDRPFIFYEGPPTANGAPGLHHVLARAFKDVIPRYKTMKGFRVERKAGWDTHGLPVELQVEKEMGLRSKQDIENIVPGNPRASIIKFNKKCKESVWKYKDLWEKLTRRMGYWVDMKNPYITYENRYIESVWWIFSQIFKAKNKKGESLVYKGHKVVPYCYRCGSTLSSHEVAQGYQTVKDNSIFVKFKVKKEENTYLLAWTTTPWTLPGNVALAINRNIKYQALSVGKDKYIVAKDRVENIFKDESYKLEYEIKSRDLIGKEYEPLFDTNDTGQKAHFVIYGDFVSTREGTGIVHIAPAFGADDAEAGRANNLPTLTTVNEQGEIKVAVPGKGIPVKKKDGTGKYKADQLIIEDLKKRNLLFKEELYEHEYPFCWRCETPLIYYSKPSWFIRMGELREKLYENGKNINWIPKNIKEGRFGEWIKEAKDWAISRERYWGTPLPIWECEKCQKLKVIESQKELEKMSRRKLKDLHKPYIDNVKLKCSCGGDMKRVPEVMDVWFDSGSMPLAQFYYPNGAVKEDKKKIENGRYFPADYIAEAIDQTRGWFYTLHAISTLLCEAGKVPAGYAYKNVICLGHILDAKGKKMSKSKGNVIDPMEVMKKYGADMLRWYLFAINQPGLYKRFDLKGMDDVRNRVFRMLWNSYLFFVMYANIDKFRPRTVKRQSVTNLLDQWIISELNVLIKKTNDALENYDIYNSVKQIEKFIDYLSNWYVRRSRKRFWKSENDEDKNKAYTTLHHVLVELSKLMAPFTPFVTEEIYKNLTGEKSVHLADYPKTDEKMIDEKLNEEMKQVRNIISETLQLRAKAGIKIRQPLNTLSVKRDVSNADLLSIIGEEVNVKEVVINKKQTEEIVLDIKINEELRLEGQAREIIRLIQEMRKEAGYEIDNRIIVSYRGQCRALEKFGEIVAREVLAKKIITQTIEKPDKEKEFRVEDGTVKIQIKR